MRLASNKYKLLVSNGLWLYRFDQAKVEQTSAANRL